MRILHISETDYEGGAGKAAFALHRELRKAGVDSLFLGECVQANRPGVYSLSGWHGLPAKIIRRIRTILDQRPLRRYANRQRDAWSVGVLKRRCLPAIDAFKPDLIHLHWISEMLPFDILGRLPVPVVWTHHDWGALTGGCRCPVACSRFMTGCGACPLLGSDDLHDLSWEVCQRKRAAWEKAAIYSVAVGSGLANDIKRSWVLGTKPCVHIPNGVDTECFFPMDQTAIRLEMGLDMDAFHILFGAFSVDLPLKGGELLMEALGTWRQQCPDLKMNLIVVGKGAARIQVPPGVTVTKLGLLASTEAMARAYNAADIVVVPSRVESFGLVAAEAQSCGVPVVGFSGTGLSDIVQHQETGFLADSQTSEGLLEGLKWIEAMSKSGLSNLGNHAAETASARFALHSVAESHIKLYNEITAAYL